MCACNTRSTSAKSSASGTHPALALLGRLPSLPAAAIRRARNRRKGRTSAHRDRPSPRSLQSQSPRPPPLPLQCTSRTRNGTGSIRRPDAAARASTRHTATSHGSGRALRPRGRNRQPATEVALRYARERSFPRCTCGALRPRASYPAADAPPTLAAPLPLHRRAAAENGRLPQPRRRRQMRGLRGVEHREAGVGTTSEVTSSVQSAGVAESAWPTAAKRPSGDGVAPASPVQCVCRVAFHFKRAGDRTRVSTSVPDPGSASRSTAARHAQRWRRSCGVPTMSADADTAAASHARSARSSCAPATAASQ